MKKTIFKLLAVLLFVSCGQNESSISLAEQGKILEQDPVAIEFFESMSATAKIIMEGGLDLEAYTEIMKSNNQDPCSVEKEVFDGDVEMENFARASCHQIIAGQAFHAKHRYVKDLSREERRELYAPLLKSKKPEHDMEKIMRNAERHIQR